MDEKNCLQCGHFYKPPKGESPDDGGFCRYMPPITHMLPTTHRITEEVAWHGRTMFPIVSVEMMCSQFIEKKPEILDS